LNDLECPIHLKVRLVDGTLDVRLLRVSDSTMHRCSLRDGRGGLEGLAPPCGQLTRCFFTSCRRCLRFMFDTVKYTFMFSGFVNVLCLFFLSITHWYSFYFRNSWKCPIHM